MMLVTISLIKVKSCSALLHMLLACNCGYLKWVLKFKFLFWITVIQTRYIYMSKNGRICDFFQAKRGLWAKILGNTNLGD